MLNLIKRLVPWSHSPKMVRDKWGVLVPEEDLKLPPVIAKEPLFLSFLQKDINAAFYGGDAYVGELSPLELFDTLGSVDKLLPKASATDYLKNNKGTAVHEIGPGNFNFATTFVDVVQQSIKDFVYNAHDFSDSTFIHIQERLAPYKGKIIFNKIPISKFSNTVTDEQLYVSLVEVLDDTMTEFVGCSEGLEGMALVRPKMDGHLKFPTKSLAAKEFSATGYSSPAVKKLAGVDVPERNYTAKEIIALLDEGNWDSLEGIHPIFLRYIEYDKQTLLYPIPLEDLLHKYLEIIPGDSSKFQQVIASHFRAQLDGVPEGYILSIPIAGLHLLWELKDRKETTIHFFDYGYADASKLIEPFSTYNGQITAPVNFGLLKNAASWLGYDVQLETNREFIKRNLGEDTLNLAYLQKAFKNSEIPLPVHLLEFDFLREKVIELSPDASPTRENILAHRIHQSDYKEFAQKIQETYGMVAPYEVPEGSYHLAVHKSQKGF